MAFAGHGLWFVRNGYVTVPSGTTLTFWMRHGTLLPDDMARHIEAGYIMDLPVLWNHNLPGAMSYLPGSVIPNYTLAPPSGTMVFMKRSITVTQDTTLNVLLRPNMGHMHWAACRLEISIAVGLAIP